MDSPSARGVPVVIEYGRVTLLSGAAKRDYEADRVGSGAAGPASLSHHRTYGSVSGGSFVLKVLAVHGARVTLTSNQPVLRLHLSNRPIRSSEDAVGVIALLDPLLGSFYSERSALHLGDVSAATMASADFWQELPPPDLPG
jgi:hypothetical protein